MINREELEYVRDVLDGCLTSPNFDGDRILTALDYIQDALQEIENDEPNAVQDSETAEDQDDEAVAEPVSANPVCTDGNASTTEA